MATIRLLHGIYASAPFRFHFPNKLSASHGHIGSQVTESVIRQRAGVNPMHIGQISIVIRMSVYKILQLFNRYYSRVLWHGSWHTTGPINMRIPPISLEA